MDRWRKPWTWHRWRRRRELKTENSHLSNRGFHSPPSWTFAAAGFETMYYQTLWVFQQAERGAGRKNMRAEESPRSKAEVRLAALLDSLPFCYPPGRAEAEEKGDAE